MGYPLLPIVPLKKLPLKQYCQTYSQCDLYFIINNILLEVQISIIL